MIKVSGTDLIERETNNNEILLGYAIFNHIQNGKRKIKNILNIAII